MTRKAIAKDQAKADQCPHRRPAVSFRRNYVSKSWNTQGEHKEQPPVFHDALERVTRERYNKNSSNTLRREDKKQPRVPRGEVQ